MKTFTLEILIKTGDSAPAVKKYRVPAVDLSMAVGMCKGQAAINGWQVLEVFDHTITGE